MRVQGVLRQLACAAVLAVSLVACSFSDPPESALSTIRPAQILKRAKQDLTHASSVRVRGDFVQDGHRYLIDLRYKASLGVKGVVVMDGLDIEILRIRRTVYGRASEDTWLELTKDKRHADEVANMLANKFVKITLTERQFREVIKATDLETFTARMFKNAGPPSAVTKSDVHSVNGAWAVGLSDTSGGVVEFAAFGPTYPLRVESGPDADEEGTFDFLDWHVPVELAKPPARQVVDLSKLNRG